MNLNLQFLFRITGAALGLQLLLGGLVTFGYIDASAHIVWGVVLGILALVTLVFVFRMPSRPMPLLRLSIGIAVDILLQGLLGFATMGTDSNALAFVHFLNSLLIFGMTLAGTFMAMAAARMSQAQQMGPMQQ